MKLTLASKETRVDLRHLGRKNERLIMKELERLAPLAADPDFETRNLKTLRENAVAQRELRLWGKVRVLFNIDVERRTVILVVVGLKRRAALIVRGREYHMHRAAP
jgi:mRNA-degrading endonuclease RelE of RelBE toxin-antitoxin system